MDCLFPVCFRYTISIWEESQGKLAPQHVCVDRASRRVFLFHTVDLATRRALLTAAGRPHSHLTAVCPAYPASAWAMIPRPPAGSRRSRAAFPQPEHPT